MLALLLLLQINYYPGPMKYEPRIYFVLSVDDNTNAAATPYVQALATMIEAKNGRLTWFVTGGELDASEQAIAAALSAKGHEIASHTFSHYYMDVTQPLAFTSTNTNPTINVDAAGKQLVLSCDEVGNRVTVSWAAASKSLADLQTAVSGKGWTVTPTLHVESTFKLSSLADSGGAKAMPYTTTADIVAPDYRLWRDEWVGNSDFIEALTGKRPTTIAWPGAAWTAGAQDYVHTTLGAYASRTTSSGPHYTSTVDMYNVTALWGGDILGAGTEAHFCALAQSAYADCYTRGGCIYHVWSHLPTEISVQQVGWFVDEIHSLGGQWVTFGAAIGSIRANQTTVDSGLHYIRSKAIP